MQRFMASTLELMGRPFGTLASGGMGNGQIAPLPNECRMVGFRFFFSTAATPSRVEACSQLSSDTQALRRKLQGSGRYQLRRGRKGRSGANALRRKLPLRRKLA